MRWAPESPAEYIEKRTEVTSTGCWEWTGTPRNRWGYGDAHLGTRRLLAHRLAYEAFVGAIPEDLLVLHHCDNPPCCNPEHLFLGTHEMNMADRDRKGRAVALSGESHPNAKLTAAAVQEIRTTAYRSATISGLARKFGVSRRAVRLAYLGETWS